MNHTPRRASDETQPSGLPVAPFAGQGALGTFLLLAGAGIGILAFIDRIAGLPFAMPRTWYSSPVLWYFFALVCFLSGARLLRLAPADEKHWKPEFPGERFKKVVIYTRPECHLCVQAKDVLRAYRDYLPETEEVDITTSPELLEKFSDQIPVVEIDGQIRFRGRVNQILLQD